MSDTWVRVKPSLGIGEGPYRVLEEFEREATHPAGYRHDVEYLRLETSPTTTETVQRRDTTPAEAPRKSLAEIDMEARRADPARRRMEENLKRVFLGESAPAPARACVETPKAPEVWPRECWVRVKDDATAVAFDGRDLGTPHAYRGRVVHMWLFEPDGTRQWAVSPLNNDAKNGRFIYPKDCEPVGESEQIQGTKQGYTSCTPPPVYPPSP